MDNYTTVELHSEIYYAEANLLLSFLTFVQVRDKSYSKLCVLYIYTYEAIGMQRRLVMI